ncbi:hypothetical protein D3C72_2528630 [compost metagenome]
MAETLSGKRCPAALRQDRLLGNGDATGFGFDQNEVGPIAFAQITAIGNGEQISYAVTSLGHEGGYRQDSVCH